MATVAHVLLEQYKILPKIIVSVSGSRNFKNYQYIEEVLNWYSPIISEINVGDAKGVDSLVTRYCNKYNIKCNIFEADWKTYGKAAGPIRNNDIISGTQLLLAFKAKDSIGTVDAIKKAFKMGIQVHVFEV